MMENLKITMECLRDLGAFHTERISGYEAMLNGLMPQDQYLATLFNAFIKQSKMMRRELLQLSAMWDGEEESQSTGRYGLAWSVVKAVFSSRMPGYLLDKCRSGENALLIAYHCIEGTEGLDASVRGLVNRQKRDVIAARDWIAHFSAAPNHRPAERLAVVT